MAEAPTQYEIETETHISWDRTGSPARLETFDPAVARRWTRAGIELKEQPVGRWTAEVAIKQISIRRPRQLTDAQKAARSESFRKVNERRLNATQE